MKEAATSLGYDIAMLFMGLGFLLGLLVVIACGVGRLAWVCLKAVACFTR
jgi:hypothetical protein